MAGRKRARVWIAAAEHSLEELAALRGRAGVDLVPIEKLDRADQPERLTIGKPVPDLRPDALFVDQRFAEDECPRDALSALRVTIDDLWNDGGLIVSWGAPTRDTGHEDMLRSDPHAEPINVFSPTSPILSPFIQVRVFKRPAKYGPSQLRSKATMRPLTRRGVRVMFSLPVKTNRSGATFIVIDGEERPCEVLLRANDDGAVLGLRVTRGQSELVVLPAPEVTLQEVVEHFLKYARIKPAVREARPSVPVLVFNRTEDTVTFFGKQVVLRPTPYKVLLYYANRAGQRVENTRVAAAVLGDKVYAESSALRTNVFEINNAVKAAAARVAIAERKAALDLAKGFLKPLPGRHPAYRLGLAQDQVVVA